MRFKRLRIKSGKVGSDPIDLDLSVPTIVVGPNRSGKSTLLREFQAWANGEEMPTLLVESIEWDLPGDVDEALGELKHIEYKHKGSRSEDEHHYRMPLVGASSGAQGQLSERNLANWLQQGDSAGLRQNFLRYLVLYLDGQTRLKLSEPTSDNRIDQPATNHLMRLFRDDVARQRIQTISKDEFGVFPVVNHTALPQLELKLSQIKPIVRDHERSLEEAAIAFFRDSEDIRTAGDGIRCFVGLLAAVYCLRQEALLVDEPEAFLHPPLSRRLGNELARRAQQEGTTLMVATHSASFLLGFLQVHADPNIVRLTYEGGVGAARTISRRRLQEIVRQPFLRSSRVLEAIFHRAVIVSEADSDRVFYDEVNRRLRAEERGVKDALFINGQGKQSLHKIVGPLRELGVPAVAIVDFDYIRSTAGEWRDLQVACNIPEVVRKKFLKQREALKNDARAAHPNNWAEEVKRSGLRALPQQTRRKHENFLRDLKDYGLFVVPDGALESWLPGYGIQKEKTEWLLAMLERLGYSEAAKNYVRPGKADVWGFMDDLSAWIANGKGMS